MYTAITNELITVKGIIYDKSYSNVTSYLNKQYMLTTLVDLKFKQLQIDLYKVENLVTSHSDILLTKYFNVRTWKQFRQLFTAMNM